MPEKEPVESSEDEEYELMPHKDIEELKNELKKLKEFEITPTKQMQVSVLDLNKKLDKLITIFEDASHQVRIEEGGLSFAEKMKPLMEKMNKVLEQNSEIASGILALADMIKDLKSEEYSPASQETKPELPPLPGQRENSFFTKPIEPRVPVPPQRMDQRPMEARHPSMQMPPQRMEQRPMEARHPSMQMPQQRQQGSAESRAPLTSPSMPRNQGIRATFSPSANPKMPAQEMPPLPPLPKKRTF